MMKMKLLRLKGSLGHFCWSTCQCYTQATLLIGSGVDIRTAQDRLGYSSAGLTMNIYSYAIEQNDRNAADTIGSAIFGKA